MRSNQNYQPVGFQTITPTVSTSLTVPTGASHALIQCLTQNVRWRDDGVDPTALVGMQLAAGKDIFYAGDLDEIEFIEETSGGVVNITYYTTADYKG